MMFEYYQQMSILELQKVHEMWDKRAYKLFQVAQFNSSDKKRKSKAQELWYDQSVKIGKLRLYLAWRRGEI